MPGSGVITAIRTVGLPARSRSYPDGRECSHPGCNTRLSIYNNGKFCYQHEPMAVPRTRGKKIA